MLITDHDEALGRTRMIVQANRSMNWTGNVVLIIALGGFGLVVASGFAYFGLWLVFPFVGLEILALTAALYCCLLKLQAKEVITVTDKYVTLERGVRSPEETVSALRLATEVEFTQRPSEFDVGELKLNLQGRAVRIGDSLGRGEKSALAEQLRRVLGA